MIYPLVRELAGDGVPVTVTCRVLKIARQPYYRWLTQPVTDAELEQAYRANALFDAHQDDPEFGYRFLVDEARDAGEPMAERTAWRICSDMGWWSAFGKPKKGKAKKPGPPVHDDLCAVVDKNGVIRHVFKADAPNELWIGDITEHRTTWIPAVVATPTGGVEAWAAQSTARSRRTGSSSWSTRAERSGLPRPPQGCIRARRTRGCVTLA